VRSRTFAAEAVTTVDGAAVVSPAWLVRSLAPIADVALLTGLVIDLVQRRQLTLDELAAEHRRWRQYPGCCRVEEVLARLAATGRVDSSLEFGLRDGLEGAGIPLDRGQVEVPCLDGVTIHLDLGVAVVPAQTRSPFVLGMTARSLADPVWTAELTRPRSGDDHGEVTGIGQRVPGILEHTKKLQGVLEAIPDLSRRFALAHRDLRAVRSAMFPVGYDSDGRRSRPPDGGRPTGRRSMCIQAGRSVTAAS
jgi:hypothetical protein